MQDWKRFLEDDGGSVKRIKKQGRMRVDALVVADEGHIEKSNDRSLEQLTNTASLPGIVGEAWGMADLHQGYGFPIGGVVATNVEDEGVISPGGVGFDINCGVRLCSIDLSFDDLGSLIRKKSGSGSKEFGNRLKGRVPSGETGKGGHRLSSGELDEILSEGAKAAAELGLGHYEDLVSMEMNGRLDGDSGSVSEIAKRRGMSALGSIGRGNHFLEIQVIDEVFDEAAAKSFGIEEGRLTAMVHTGSRGLGYQVCSEHVKFLEGKYKKTDGTWHAEEWEIGVADIQLASAPFFSKDGQSYFEAMKAAGNYAFANRSAVTQQLRNALKDHMGSEVDIEVVYDVCHNIARLEEHDVHGSTCSCCVHRKGATRAFGGDSPSLSGRFSGVGQPVLVPGDMGTSSYVLAGPEGGSNRAFGSSCHGAGRALSRRDARSKIDGLAVKKELEEKGTYIYETTERCLSEEAPDAYKDIDEVIRLTDEAGLARPVARLRPLIVIKG
ncbi:MAG: RtcB family protein [Candidatus Thalassarchaeaceae archaeon]|jgi:tRNA-splicing ligase RtcB|nr:RtcB family protein [Candidatus Thalassarchaeaceae archaeon]